MAIDLADGGVQVDRQRLGGGAGTGGPHPGEDPFGEPVELADVPGGERAQERP